MVQLSQIPRAVLSDQAEVLDFAGRSVGAIDTHVDVSRPTSPHRVGVLTTRAGETLVAKWFGDQSSYFSTVDALNHYAKPLGSAVPKLIDQHDGLKAVLMTTLPGHAVIGEVVWDPVVSFRVGQLLRQFHESAPATTSTDLPTQMAHRLSRLIDQCESELGMVSAQELRGSAMELLDLGRLTLQPTHGHLAPEHWMVDQDYGVQLLSFSASEYDPWIVDTRILEQRYWQTSAELRKAFFAGYDRIPDDTDAVVLTVSLAISALDKWITVRSHSGSSKKTRTLAWSLVESVCGATLF